MKKLIKIRSLVALFILCCCYVVSYSQAFEAKESPLVNGDIGEPVLYSSSGLTVFVSYDEKTNDLQISVFDKNKKPFYINKKLVFNKINFKNYPTLKINDSRNTLDWYEKDGNIFFSISSRKTSHLIQVEARTGIVISEEEQDVKNYYVTKFYNEINRGYVMLASDEFDNDKQNPDIINSQLVISNSEAKINQVVNYDNVDNVFLKSKILDCYYDNEDIYFTVLLSGKHQNKANLMDKYIYLSKYNLVSKKLTHVELCQVEKDVTYYTANIINNSVDNSIIVNHYFIDKKNKDSSEEPLLYRTSLQKVNKLNMIKNEKFILPTNLTYKYIKEKNKINFKSGKLYNLMSDKKGNILSLIIKSEFFYEGKVLGISYFDFNGKEIYGLGYKFNLNYEVADNFLRNVTMTSSSSCNIIFLNNLPANINLQPEAKPKQLNKYNGTAIAVQIDNEGNVSQYFVFGQPKSEDEYKNVDFYRAYKDFVSNTIVAKMWDSEFGKTRAVWIKLK